MQSKQDFTFYFGGSLLRRMFSAENHTNTNINLVSIKLNRKKKGYVSAK